jgi:EAL domain-containing protein (putative c-di-GMP-specific phosphodiesterase class I)/CheY-like chemotaxis protein
MPDSINCHSRYPMKPRPHILFADQEPESAEPLARSLRRQFKVTIVRSADAAIRVIQSTESFAVLISCLRSSAIDGIKFLDRIRASAPDISVIILTCNDSLPIAIDIFNAGHVFLIRDKECPTPQLVEAVDAGIERHDARRTERLLRFGSLGNREPALDEPSATVLGLLSPATKDPEDRRRQILQRLRDPQFVENVRCAYQPKWDIARGSFAGMEALARWLDPYLGPVSPGEFVLLAEKEPEIAERLGEWVLLTACRQRLAWRGLISESARVAVNISATELCSGNLHDKVMRCLAEVGLPARMLEIEITESAAIVDLAKSVEQLQALRGEGVDIAIDDFGVGFSSLSYLGELPASSLKIDRSFIRTIEEGGRRADLLRAICGLGHAIHLAVVVEGVESLQTVGWLRSVGCDMVQGFALGRPLMPDAFETWYRGDRFAVAAALGRVSSLCVTS